MELRNPVFLLLIVPLVAMVYYSLFHRKEAGLRIPSSSLLVGLPSSWKVKFRRNLIFLRAGALLLLIIALSQPQIILERTKIYRKGIDIVLAVDVSGSMLAEDFTIGHRRASRIEVVKRVVQEFIQGRDSDRIGIVAFAGRAYTVAPLTLDYNWLFETLKRLKVGVIEDGTAIGSGIMVALRHLKDMPEKGKVIILLTDGRNNAGKISPFTAAEAAKALGVKIYTIGAGTKGLAPYPVRDMFGNVTYQPVRIDIDEDTLKKIASQTGARYYRATDTQSLRKIYQEISRLEKTPIEEKQWRRYKELFPAFLIPGLCMLVAEIFMASTILRKVP